MSRIDSLHALSEFAPLARQELQLMSAQITPAGAALVLHPRDATQFPLLPWRNGTCARARIEGDVLIGDISGDVGHLQVKDESFDIVVVQHGAEMLDATSELIAEIDRVLAADGRLYWFGLNPLNPWCVLKRTRRRIASNEMADGRLHLHSARTIQNELRRRAIVVDKSNVFGGWWLRDDDSVSQSGNGVTRNGMFDTLAAAYLLSARKQRAVLTPIAPARSRPQLRVAGETRGTGERSNRRMTSATPTSAEVELITDGACIGNPGPGGWGALLRNKGHERELSGGEADTTNNRMELMAAITGLEALRKPSQVLLTTDSQYVQRGVEEWMSAWKARGWKTSAGQAVKNRDLWERLATALMPHTVRWKWVRGHSGHVDNERVDALARSAAEAIRDGAMQSGI